MPDIKRSLRKFLPYLLKTREENQNEADTVRVLCKFFEDVLEYDGIEDISREANLKGKFVDICLKVDGKVRLLIEAKAGRVALRDRHIDQAQSYAAQNNFRWVLLTNSVEWNLYHLTFDEGIEYERAFAVSLSDDSGIDEAAAKIGLLHKGAIKKGDLDAFWNTSTALSAASIGKSLFTESVLRVLRRQIRKDSKMLVDQEDIAKAIREMLSVEARERIGQRKIRRTRRADKGVSGTGSAPLTA